MAASTKLSDNEMNYYQFKAKQILLEKKEEKEWQDYCKQIAPDCAACLAEKADTKESRDVGIQTFPKRLSLRAETPLQSKSKSQEIPEALIKMKTSLDKISSALSKLFDDSDEAKATQKHLFSENRPLNQQRSHMTLTPTFPIQQTTQPLEVQRKLQIQNNFKTSLQNSVSVLSKKSSAIKPKNSSFFLSHDLEVKRAAARRAYLASLQAKPKVSFPNKKQSSTESAKTTQSKRNVPARKKALPKKGDQKSKEDTEDTIIKDFIANETKDENIEGVVDAIFEDLLGEAALDLNRIRQKKKDNYCNKQSEELYKTGKLSIPCNPLSSSSMKCEDSKSIATDKSSIYKLKMFLDSYKEIQEENNLRKSKIELAEKGTSTVNIEDSETVHAKITMVNTNCQKKEELPKTAPKFVCGIKNIIKIDPDTAKDIASKRDGFWRYLEKTSQIPKGNFNPWILNESIAESILDDYISDIAEELSKMPSSIIQDLYNQEFVQQVEM